MQPVEGIIRWDIDWDHLAATGEYKLCIVDNGDGMSASDMQQYLNSLAVEGANGSQGITANFGVGAKITALYHNRNGLIYSSWQAGHGAMVKLHRDDKAGEYGLASWDLPGGGISYAPTVKETARPHGLDDGYGTRVTLLGTDQHPNTCLPPTGNSGESMNWLLRYLNTRYFRVPENVRMQVRVLTRSTEKWPSTEPSPSDKAFNLETVRGAKAIFDNQSDASGMLRLRDVDVHWWLFNDPREASHRMSSRGLRTQLTSIVFQDELYILRKPPAARQILASFGLIFGSDSVCICVEPRDHLDIRADTARSRLVINGEDIEDRDWWSEWGAEFKERMPQELRDHIDRILALTESEEESESRNRIRERLDKIKELLRPSRNRKNATGDLLAKGAVTGGLAADSDNQPTGNTNRRSGEHGGRRNDAYLAELLDEGGEPAEELKPRPKEPTVRWVSKTTGTREEDENEDRAAWFPANPLTDGELKANEDFRGFIDLVNWCLKDFRVEDDHDLRARVRQLVKEWMETQLIESIMATRALHNSGTWADDDIKKALSAEALTSLMMTRYFVVEKVKRSLGSEIGKARSAA